MLWCEFSTGALLGTAYGVLLGGFVSLVPHFREHTWKLPLVVALAIFVNMIIAATVGTLIPMFFKRIRIDPAIATGPFVTTAIDVFGIFTYFFAGEGLSFLMAVGIRGVRCAHSQQSVKRFLI